MSPEHPRVTVVCQDMSPRITYIINHIFDEFLGVSYAISSQPLVHADIVIYYGVVPCTEGVSIPQHPFMLEATITQGTLDIVKRHGLPCSFMVSTAGVLDFDLFAWLFYLLSRYEEYQDYVPDRHGRYASTNSISVKHDFIEMAVVDRWILHFCEIIYRYSGVDLTPKRSMTVIPSIDIDMPYAYRYKGARKYIGVMRDLLSGNTGGVQDRIQSWFSGYDPFETFEELEGALSAFERPLFFLLHNYQPPYDLNHIAYSPSWEVLIKDLARWTSIGLHPSYASHEAQETLAHEYQQLSGHIGFIAHSRQHFIRSVMPDTYRDLIALGIEHDHSMIYPDRMGFRAGTTRPFRWYDLRAECTTELWIHSYACMDVAMRYYHQLQPHEAIVRCKKILNEVAEVKGDFGFIWHNSSLSRAYGWYAWRKVFHYLVTHKINNK